MAYGYLSLIHQALPAMCVVDPAGRFRLDWWWWSAVIVKKINRICDLTTEQI